MHEDLDIIKVIYALLGKWPARVFAYIAIGWCVLWGLPRAADNYALLGEKFAGVSWTPQSFLDLVLAVFFLVLFGFVIVAAVRVTGLLLYRNEIKEIRADIELIKKRLDLADPPKESETDDG